MTDLNLGYVAQMQQIKFDLFKSQDPETGRFDIIFEIEGKLLYAHKMCINFNDITKNRELFDIILSSRWAPNNDEPIKITSYTFDEFFLFITFLYSGKCQLTDSNIYSMVDMAEFFGVQFFKTCCADYLAAMTITTENVFQLMELAEIYSMVQLKSKLQIFVGQKFNTVLKNNSLIKASKKALENVVTALKDKARPETLFQSVYKWCEKQAIDKQANDPKIDLNDAIKAEFSDFFSHMAFDKMKYNFLLDFVVPRAFVFSSYNELSKILSDHNFITKQVKVTNSRKQTIIGTTSDVDACKMIRPLMFSQSTSSSRTPHIAWQTGYKIPYDLSNLTKREGVEWYLICSAHGNIGVKSSGDLVQTDYLLAEMIPGDSGFQMTRGCKIEIL